MYLSCNPNVFYNILRKYLNGWGSKECGLIFENNENKENNQNNQKVKYHGGSAAQSSLIQLFDIIFGIKHKSKITSYLQEMRDYMPAEHREFLTKIESDMEINSLNKYVIDSNDEDLTNIYNKCIEMMEIFRSKHMGLVHTYILKMAPEDNKVEGTGGTQLISFLKTSKKETTDTKVPINKQTVTPWIVEGNIDYMKLIKQFGTELIDLDLMNKFEYVTKKKLHPWIKRGIFFSHRELNKLLDAYQNKEPIFLYTGRGPSNEMHLGHMIPFMFTKWLQDVFDCPLVIQISDDEKYYFKSLEFVDVHELGYENAKDIVAFGFNVKKTFIFSNRDYRLNVPKFEEFVSIMKKNITAKQVAKIFAFGDKLEVDGKKYYTFKDNVTVGMMDWPFYQSAAAFSQAFPHIFKGKSAHCLVAYAIDQDPYFRMARDIATKMNLIKPYSIMSTFIPPLTGSSGKMSSSMNINASLFLSDKPEILYEKIMKYTFSGGGNGTLADHRKYGGNPYTDISYQYLRYFEFDDEVLGQIKNDFEMGKMTCGQIKKIMAKKVISLIIEHQTKKSQITELDIKEYYALKSME